MSTGSAAHTIATSARAAMPAVIQRSKLEESAARKAEKSIAAAAATARSVAATIIHGTMPNAQPARARKSARAGEGGKAVDCHEMRDPHEYRGKHA